MWSYRRPWVTCGARHFPTIRRGAGSVISQAIVEGNVQVHDETLGFVPLKVTGVPEDEKVFFENGDFEGLLKHMQEKGEIGTAKPSKKAKKSKKSK